MGLEYSTPIQSDFPMYKQPNPVLNGYFRGSKCTKDLSTKQRSTLEYYCSTRTDRTSAVAGPIRGLANKENASMNYCGLLKYSRVPDHKSLLLHSEIRWISTGKILNSIPELREKMDLFFKTDDPEYSENVSNVMWNT
ncbi:hypothetical protein Trydic_g1903 [Trypoxylus dichotomus]